MVGPKKTLFMDEISTGLDSSTTFQIVKCMGDFVHLREGTVLMSLLQPAPEVYNLFDDILLRSEGIVSAVFGCMLSFCLTKAVQSSHQRLGLYVQKLQEGTWLYGCVSRTQRQELCWVSLGMSTCTNVYVVSLECFHLMHLSMSHLRDM